MVRRGFFLGEASPEDLAKVKGALGEQARSLVGAGVDGLAVETMRQTAEGGGAIAAAVAAAEGRVPVIASVSLDESQRMADGTPAEEIARLMKEWGADVIGANCSDGPMSVLTSMERMKDAMRPLVAMPNAGLPRRVDE